MAIEEEIQAKPPRDLKRILTMLYMGINLSAMVLGLYLVYSSTLGYTSPQVTSAELNEQLQELRKSFSDTPMIFNMEQLNTNLNGLPRRLVRVEMNLEMLDAEGFEEVINLGGRGRDAIVRIINGKTFDDIETVQGKLTLKNEIIAQLNGLLERGVVKNVYFSDFVVQ